jgi:hypothetical protein
VLIRDSRIGFGENATNTLRCQFNLKKCDLLQILLSDSSKPFETLGVSLPETPLPSGVLHVQVSASPRALNIKVMLYLSLLD